MPVNIYNFKEEKIDAGRNEMDQRLAQYKREAERRARIEAESNREGRAAKKKEKKSKRSTRNRDRKSSNSSSNISKQNDEGESKTKNWTSAAQGPLGG